MERLIQRFYEKYSQTGTDQIRNFINVIDWDNRMIGVRGARGVGKTTLLLQYIKTNFQPDNKILYASLDNFYFAENKLYNLAEEFVKKGGAVLVLDEVHRYKNWAVEVKNIYDDFSGLKIIFTGSSLLHLKQANADLSRRAVMYDMPGLSFREFLSFETGLKFPSYGLESILNDHIKIAVEMIGQFKPLNHFGNYLQYGYYPFYLENLNSFHQKLFETIQLVVEVDIPQFEMVQTSNIIYIKRLLQIIASSVPFKPNLSAISQRTGISLNTLKTYLRYLEKAGLISSLHFQARAINSLNKPEKLFLDNTNLMFSLSEQQFNIGNARETFFLNQLRTVATVNASKSADFYVNNKYSFEIGGQSKTRKQIKGLPNSFVVKDDIEVGYENVIPLWLFGFLY
jgi:predicted AAA+ superfamily ATPase